VYHHNGKLLFNFLKQWKFIFLKISFNCDGKKLTVSRKKAKMLTINRKSHHPIETVEKSIQMNAIPKQV